MKVQEEYIFASAVWNTSWAHGWWRPWWNAEDLKSWDRLPSECLLRPDTQGCFPIWRPWVVLLSHVFVQESSVHIGVASVHQLLALSSVHCKKPLPRYCWFSKSSKPIGDMETMTLLFPSYPPFMCLSSRKLFDRHQQPSVSSMQK